MNKDLLETNVEYLNDPDDFKMPYRLYGKTDLENMLHRYQKLSNRGYGLIVRLRKYGET
jgi:hypothetical protein